MRRGAYLAAALGRAVSVSPDIVLTRDLLLADMLLRLPKSLRPPIVYESHGYAPAMAAERPRGHLRCGTRVVAQAARLTARESRVWRTAAGYMTLTRVHQQELQDRFGVRENAAVVPDGVRLDRPAHADAGAAAAPFTITYAGPPVSVEGRGRADRRAGRHPAVPKPASSAASRERATTCGWRRCARDTGVATRVTFTGWLPPASVTAELARAHVLVLPNTRTHTSERYTSPLKLFEYLAAGRPIVASDLAAIREVLRDEENALLVEPGSAAALAGGAPADGRSRARRAAGRRALRGRGARTAGTRVPSESKP